MAQFERFMKHYSTVSFMVLLAFIIMDYYLPITSSLMNPLGQTSNYSPKYYGRNINVGFMVIPRK